MYYYDYDNIDLAQLQGQVLVILGIMAALVIVPNLWAWLRCQRWWRHLVVWFLRRFYKVFDMVCFAVFVAFALAWYPVACLVSAVRMRLNPAAEKRRQLGRYLATLPPHSGLTYYEEMAQDIRSLPPGPAKAELMRYFKKVKPPSEGCIQRARMRRGQPRVSKGVVNTLLRGDIPYCMRPKTSVIHPDSIVALAERGAL